MSSVEMQASIKPTEKGSVWCYETSRFKEFDRFFMVHPESEYLRVGRY